MPKLGLTPTLFARAAARAGMSCKVVRHPLSGIDHALLPVVLLLIDNQACLLMGWSDSGEVANLLFPESGQGAVALSRQDLESRYIGVEIF